MATSIPEASIQQGPKDGGVGIALNADTTRLRAVDGSATLASEGPSHPEFLLPVFDLAEYLSGRADPGASHAQCRALAECLRATGCVVVRDPRTSEADSKRFLDMMERYFGQDVAAKMADVCPELHYQVGATPEGVEVPRCLADAECLAAMAGQPAASRATLPTGADAKWRFFWRLGPRPATTAYAELNADPVVPRGFPEWTEVMDGWGSKMLAAVETAAEMAARGFGLEPDAFTRRMRLGPHLLAPTGADLGVHGERGAVLAGWHYDLNFLSAHGKSRFPGLAVWLQDGRRLPVSIPNGCLLLQAGKQLEWLTSGHVRAGMHEVVCTDATCAAVTRARAEGRPLWRVSSTVFAHVASDEVLAPLGAFAGSPGAAEYPPTPAGLQVQRELEAIQLKAS
ncbi:hypothetical protein WJX81_008332 [Elliptochloris bilobata]|uniref:Uncharacterized protein n=1 Tax=Elliptochloris bilobata TaxID=381761 RepID=A0AAW1S8U2_9CHLO